MATPHAAGVAALVAQATGAQRLRAVGTAGADRPAAASAVRPTWGRIGAGALSRRRPRAATGDHLGRRRPARRHVRRGRRAARRRPAGGRGARRGRRRDRHGRQRRGSPRCRPCPASSTVEPERTISCRRRTHQCSSARDLGQLRRAQRAVFERARVLLGLGDVAEPGDRDGPRAARPEPAERALGERAAVAGEDLADGRDPGRPLRRSARRRRRTAATPARPTGCRRRSSGVLVVRRPSRPMASGVRLTLARSCRSHRASDLRRVVQDAELVLHGHAPGLPAPNAAARSGSSVLQRVAADEPFGDELLARVRERRARPRRTVRCGAGRGRGGRCRAAAASPRRARRRYSGGVVGAGAAPWCPGRTRCPTCWRSPPRRGGRPSARPSTSSLWPAPYTSAVSKNVTPRSRARCTARIDSSSSTSPQPSGRPSSSENGPPIAQQPKPSALTSASPSVRRPVQMSVREQSCTHPGTWSALRVQPFSGVTLSSWLTTRGRVKVETSPKRIRAYVGGQLVADTPSAALVWEIPYYPTLYLPAGRRARRSWRRPARPSTPPAAARRRCTTWSSTARS